MPPRRQPRAGQIARELAQIQHALPGNLVRRTTACGKRGCRCQAEPPILHGPYLSWIRKVDGRTITRKLTPEQEQRYQPWFDNTRRLHDLVNELQALSVEAFDEAEGFADK